MNAFTTAERRLGHPLAAPRLIAALLLTAPGGCIDAPAPADDGPHVAIGVAALSLPDVGNVEYTLTVVNLAGQTVWTRQVDADGYGDGAGGVSVVGTCDAGSSPNTVRLTVDALYATGGALISPGDYVNPTASGPLTRSVACVANADAAVDFDLTIARRADQGFFDIAVTFSDVYCSAKLDCGATTAPADDLLLLHDDDGQRATTAVLAFACTGGRSADETYLYLDDLEIACDLGSGLYTVVDVSGVGNVDLTAPPSANPDGYLFGAAVHRGVEQLAQKAYWNVSLGLDRARFAALGACTLRTAATASSEALTGFATPSGAAYPVIRWQVPLSNGGGRLCTTQPLDGGDGVATSYSDGAAPEAFDVQYQRGPNAVTARLLGAACDAAHGVGCRAGYVCGAGDACLADVGTHCDGDADCDTGICGPGDVCASPGCDDGRQNGDETDIDCGGSCDPCANGAACDDAGDCASEICAGTCVATCSDDAQCPSGETCSGGSCYTGFMWVSQGTASRTIVRGACSTTKTSGEICDATTLGEEIHIGSGGSVEWKPIGSGGQGYSASGVNTATLTITGGKSCGSDSSATETVTLYVCVGIP